MKLIIGLGNPGEDYENTRHNIGFIFVNALAKHFGAPDFEANKKTLSEVAKVKTLILAKPQTFMNKSGLAVLTLAKFYKVKPKDIWVIHDDIDILWGEFKTSFGRSSAGHKGVESIIKNLKTKDFWRIRIGIQPTVKKHTKADKIILKKFTLQEIKTLNQTIKGAFTMLENSYK